MITQKTVFTNLTDNKLLMNWAGISLPPHGQITLDGAYPSACRRRAMHADISTAVAQGLLRLELITSLDVVQDKEELLHAGATVPCVDRFRKQPAAVTRAAARPEKSVLVSTKELPPEHVTEPPELQGTLLPVFSSGAGVAALKIVDGKPQMRTAHRDGMLLHLSKFPRRACPRRALIVGKGPSMLEWRGVPDVDAIFTLNEATYVVDRQHFHCRGDGNIKDHRFCDWLPSYAVPMVPERIKNYYNYGYWFRWEDIGDTTICLTVVQAMRLAWWMGARDIVMTGCDALYGGTTEYSPLVRNARNANCRYKEQRDRVCQLPEEMLRCCSDWTGKPLTDVLREYLLSAR